MISHLIGDTNSAFVRVVFVLREKLPQLSEDGSIVPNPLGSIGCHIARIITGSPVFLVAIRRDGDIAESIGVCVIRVGVAFLAK